MTVSKRDRIGKPYEVQVRVNGKYIYGGTFSRPFDAYIKNAELKSTQLEKNKPIKNRKKEGAYNYMDRPYGSASELLSRAW